MDKNGEQILKNVQLDRILKTYSETITAGKTPLQTILELIEVLNVVNELESKEERQELIQETLEKNLCFLPYVSKLENELNYYFITKANNQ